MGHGHSHGHGDDHGASWDTWFESGRLRLVLAALIAVLVATVAGLFFSWPTGVGQQQALERAADIGLSTERINASVISSENAACSYSSIDFPQECRLLTLDLLEGPDAGAQVALPEINLSIERGLPQFEPGDGVILGFVPTTNTYFYEDIDRGGALLALGAIFVIIVVVFGRLRGLLALLSMAVTVGVFVAYIAPSVLDGNDPVLVALIGATLIAFVSFYLTHGFSPTTTVALAGTISALGLTFLLSWVFFELARFTGFSSGEALVLPVLNENLNLSSLMLGGAIIGALGALDDVTVTQVATVGEIRRLDRSLPSSQLISSGLSIGRDHIAATVNTLLLAYAGASLPLILLFAASDQSLASVANSEVIAIEIVRTLCGSIGLIAAVPLTTILAAAILPAQPGSSAVSSHGDAKDESSIAEDIAEDDVIPAPTWSDFAPDDPS